MELHPHQVPAIVLEIVKLNSFVDFNTYVEQIIMNASELKRLLKAKGCTFETHRGGSGHLTVIFNGRRAQLPMHGSGKELGKGLVRAILKQLGLNEEGQS